MRANKFLIFLWALVFISVAARPAVLAKAASDDAADVRRAVRRAFEQMKARRYDDLYDSLSASARSRVSRASFTSSMERAENSYELDRMEIGAVRVRGNTAVADTVIYGRVLKPLEGEGKIVSQQTLVREGGEWRISTTPGAGSRSARVYLRREGRWVDVTSALRAAARRRGR